MLVALVALLPKYGRPIERKRHRISQIRRREPRLHAPEVLPLVDKLLDDGLLIVSVKSRLALVPLEHMEDICVILILA